MFSLLHLQAPCFVLPRKGSTWLPCSPVEHDTFQLWRWKHRHAPPYQGDQALDNNWQLFGIESNFTTYEVFANWEGIFNFICRIRNVHLYLSFLYPWMWFFWGIHHNWSNVEKRKEALHNILHASVFFYVSIYTDHSINGYQIIPSTFSNLLCEQEVLTMKPLRAWIPLFSVIHLFIYLRKYLVFLSFYVLGQKDLGI